VGSVMCIRDRNKNATGLPLQEGRRFSDDLVEMRGIEPLTSALRTPRSPS
jgi:hypothetical protein